jgi:choline dehydrogenase-like flavoprotein
MGTTRAAADPSSGVVDGNCAVYGHENLYIAGSSVFSSVGHANPSFTLLQLSLRLSRYLGKLAS